MRNRSSISVTRIFSYFLSAIILALGATVIIGWYTKNITLLQVLPDAVAMQYNTALGFVLLGLGIIFSLRDSRKTVMVLSSLLFLLGFLTLIEYIFDWNIGIDELFMDHYITDKVSHKGRMAPNTAICFTLSGLTLLLNYMLSGRKRLLVIGILSTTVTVLGTLAFLGYFIDFEDAYAWGDYTKMAVHTAFGFILAGLSMLAGVWFYRTGKNWIESSITRRLSFYIIVPLGILYVIMASYSIYLVQTATFEESYLKLKEVVWQNTNNLEKEINDFEEVARSIRRVLLTQSELRQAEINSMLIEEIERNQNIQGIVIAFAPYAYFKNQKLFAPYAQRRDDTVEIVDFAKEDYDYTEGAHEWYDKPISESRGVWSEPYFDDEYANEWLITYSVPVYKYDEIWAVVAVDLPLSNINEVLAPTNLDDFAYGIISNVGTYLYASYNSELIGQNIYHQGDTRGMLQKDRMALADEMLKGDFGYKEADLIGGDSFQTFFNPLESSEWVFFMGQNRSQIMVAIKRVIVRMTFFFILILLLFIWIIYYVSQQLTLRIKGLNTATHQITEGNLDTQLIVEVDDEIGDLSRNFAEMTKQLRIREQDLRSLNEELEDKVAERTRQLEDAIVELKENQEAIKVSEELFKSLVNNMPGVVYRCGLVDPWEMYFISDEIEKLSGYPGSDFMGENPKRTFGDIMHPNDREPISKNANDAIRKNKSYINEYRIIHKDGSIRYVHAQGQAYYDKEGKADFLVGTIFDISERRKLEIQIKNERAQLQRYLDYSPIAVIISVDGIAKYVNQKFNELFGLTPGDSVEDRYINGKDREILLQKLSEETSLVSHQMKYLDKNGEIVDVLLSTNRITFNGEKAMLSWLVDISELKAIENQLVIAKDQADQANRSKSSFLANMSHEIRTPMNAVLGFSELLDKLVTTDLEKSYVSSITSSGKSLLALINDILDLSKIEAGKIELEIDTFNVSTVLEEMRSIFSLKVQEKGLSFILETDPDQDLFIKSDEVRFRQILINLINNAIKFTEQGYVKVSLRVEELQKMHAKAGLINLSVAVEDTGIGVSEDFKQKLFKTFTQQDGRTTKRFGGTGLGLAISKNLAELMNGDITVESEEGKGSTFTLVLNEVEVTEELQVQKEQDNMDNELLVFEPATILIVDDIEDNRKYARGVLRKYQFDLIEAKDGREALDVLNHTKVDLVLTDLRMPHMDGFELIKQIHANEALKDIPIVATSASVMEFNVNKARKHDFNDFVPKPFRINDLVTCFIRFLPSNIDALKEPREDRTTEMEIHLDPDRRQELAEVFDELLELNTDLQQQQATNDVELFGKRLIEVGEAFNIQPVTAYGQSLLSALKSFDIENMLSLINQFSVFVDEVKAKLNGNPE